MNPSKSCRQPEMAHDARISLQGRQSAFSGSNSLYANMLPFIPEGRGASGRWYDLTYDDFAAKISLKSKLLTAISVSHLLSHCAPTVISGGS